MLQKYTTDNFGETV